MMTDVAAVSVDYLGWLAAAAAAAVSVGFLSWRAAIELAIDFNKIMDKWIVQAYSER